MAPASAEQIADVISLLDRRRIAGDGGGFGNPAPFYRLDGSIDIATVYALTGAEAAALIDSFKG